MWLVLQETLQCVSCNDSLTKVPQKIVATFCLKYVQGIFTIVLLNYYLIAINNKKLKLLKLNEQFIRNGCAIIQ